MADDGADNRSQRPLAGVIMCCTSIPPEERSHLASIAFEMGAISQLDLTSDVTHLIVGDTDTPKYKYVAKERPDVKCLLPEWIEAVRQSWMEGGETNVQALELQYHLPTLAGLKVCVTGFEDPVVRKQLEETVKKNGGQYRGDLSKDITHLVACRPAGSKYNAAKSWGIRVVSIEWLHQSLERGMILNEDLYDPLLPVGDRGRDAWVRKQVSTSPSTKRPREDNIGVVTSRKLRRTASAKFESQNDGMWTDIVGGGFETEAHVEREGDSKSNSRTITNVENSFTTTPNQSNLENRMVNDEEKQKPRDVTPLIPSAGADALFKGKRFCLHSFDDKQTAILQKHLHSHGAEVIESLALMSRISPLAMMDSWFLLVPHALFSRELPSIPDKGLPPIIVTDMWVEYCLYKKKYVPPESHVTFRPFKHPILGFDRLIICSTAFEGVDLLHLSKVVKLLGAAYSECLTPRSSLLICNGSLSTREKLCHALDWNIPILRPEWLWDCIQSGQKLRFAPYLMHPAQRARSKIIARKDPTISHPNVRNDSHRADPKPNKEESEDPDQRDSQDKRANRKKDLVVESHSGEVPSNTLSGHFDGQCDTFYTPNDEHPSDFADGQNQSRSSRQEIRRTSSSQVLSHGTSRSPNMHSSNIVTEKPWPLNELSPNSPTKPISPLKTSPAKSVRPISSHQNNTESLSTEISSLLAHHQRELSNPPPLLRTESSTLGRRKRQLFGRAPSNISARSVNLSRASSVDTMNTDGLGTPLEASRPTTATASTLLKSGKDVNANANANVSIINPDCKSSMTASVLATYLESNDDDYFHEDEEAKQKLQMTQLGYEDPEAEAWRQKLTRKVGGGGVAAAAAATEGENEKEKGGGVEVRIKSSRVTVKDDVGIGEQSVSMRTRRAGR